jgi:hypothetical protein
LRGRPLQLLVHALLSGHRQHWTSSASGSRRPEALFFRPRSGVSRRIPARDHRFLCAITRVLLHRQIADRKIPRHASSPSSSRSSARGSSMLRSRIGVLQRLRSGRSRRSMSVGKARQAMNLRRDHHALRGITEVRVRAFPFRILLEAISEATDHNRDHALVSVTKSIARMFQRQNAHRTRQCRACDTSAKTRARPSAVSSPPFT